MMTHVDLTTATHAFYAALTAYLNGDGAPMQAIWLPDERISTGRPMGTWAVGRRQVLESWTAMSSVFSSGHVTPTNLRTRVLAEDMGYVLTDDLAEVIAMRNLVMFKTRSTNIFRLVDGVCYVVHHHVDIARELQKAVVG